MRILYLEDNQNMSKLVSQFLSQYGIIDPVYNLEDAKNLLATYQYDFVLLDRDIKGKDIGLTLIDFIKEINPTAYIIVISSFSNIEDKIQSLDLGANDYLEKPFDLQELYARMMALQRQNAPTKIEIKGLLCDTKEKRLFYEDKEIILSHKENDLLFYLIMNRKKIVSHDQLVNALYLHPEEVAPNTIRVTITHIRKKLPVDILKTIKTRGYTIESD
jgi:two-component system OmpR family response regulator